MSRTLLPLSLLAATLLAAPSHAAQSRAYCTTSDLPFGGSTGGLSAIDLTTRAVSPDVQSVYKDAVLRWSDGLIYVLNREGQDNVQVIDPAAGYATIRNFSVGNGLNPQDICFVSPTKAYVSRYDSPDLLIVNPSSPSGTPMSSIALGAFADGDGVPEMSRMVRVGRWLFVACQRLTAFSPTNPSVVVVVDTQADTVVDVDPVAPGRQAITLVARNPITTFAWDPVGVRLLIGCVGNYGVNDGGIEAIDPVGLTSLGIVATEAELGGDVFALAWHSPARAYAIVGFTTALVSWNPTTGLRIGTVFQPGGFSLSDVEVNDRGEVYVGRNGGSPTGVYVFRAVADTLIAGPLDTGLPPFDLTFDQVSDRVTGAPPAVVSGLMVSPAWPNPARVSAAFALRLSEGARVRADVFDLSGRRVRRLVDDAWTAGERRIEWDLRVASGRAASSGIYLARFAVDGREFVRRVVVVR